MPALLLAAALFASAPSPAPAPAPAVAAPIKVAMTCPIGGEPFEYIRAIVPPPTDQRPDGKPYGAIRTPPAIPECPDNGLVLYKDYSPAEVEKLIPVVASPEYQALRSQGTSYYRAYRLMRVLGESPDDYLWTLMQASWEADNRPELRALYLTELVEASAEVPPRPEDVEWIGMEARSANALRELGRFEEAKARLAKLPLASLDVPLPAAGAVSEAKMADIRSRRGWLGYVKRLAVVIERQDKSLEPIDMIPRTIAIGLCIDKEGSLDEQQRAFCDRQATAVEEMRAARTEQSREMDLLRRSREESGR